MSPPAPPRRRTPPTAARALLAILLVALLVGLAATYLAAPSPGSPASGGGLPLGLRGTQAFGIALLALLVAPLALLFVMFAWRRRGPTPYHAYLNLLLIALLFLAFLAVARSISYGPSLSTGPAANDTGGSGFNASPPGSNVTGNGSLPGPILPGIPGWVGYAVLIGIVVAAIAVLLLRIRPEGFPGDDEPRAPEVRSSLEAALSALAPGAPEDPRAVIVALYAKLLERVAPNLRRADAATAREIERESVERLGLSAGHARTLTGLFEEARYSTHPLSAARVVEARTALAGALDDLARRGPRP